ncbi:MAG TPA: hypothetical protein VIM10_08760 [Actinopolymorphaceae bacterium]
MAYYKGKLRGSTARRRSLPAEVFLALPVPLPTANEQRRIAAILDQIDDIRATRREVLNHVDTLPQSIFQDMFRESMAIAPRIDLIELTKVITKGTTPTTVGLAFRARGVPFLRAQNLQRGTVAFSPHDLFIDGDAHEILKRSRVLPQDVLISIAGTIGRIAVVPAGSPEMNCNQAVAVIRLNDPCLAPWLMSWLNSLDAQSQIGASSVTGTISNLSLGQIRRLKVPAVDGPAVQAFAQRIRAVNEHRSAVTRTDTNVDDLFASLQSRAFRGEL